MGGDGENEYRYCRGYRPDLLARLLAARAAGVPGWRAADAPLGSAGQKITDRNDFLVSKAKKYTPGSILKQP